MELKNNYEVTIANLKLLKAAYKGRGYRPNIKGIYFNPNGWCYVTDGHVMGVTRANLDTSPIGCLLISEESIKIGRLEDKSICSLVRIAESNSYNVVSCETKKHIGVVALGECNDFPDCPFILSQVENKKPTISITFDAVLLDKISGAICSDHRNSEPLTLDIFDDSTVAVLRNHLSDNIAGAIMPMRRP